MFQGERGCGKTTLAGILSNMFEAEEMNVRTINCGYYTKIDDMRKEIDKLHKSSLFGDKRVLIMDEVHKLSQASQNAWLNPLENLPENVLVIACTTETKLIKTFLERFVIYQVSKLSKKESKLLVEKAITDNKITGLPKWVKARIIEKSEGIPRLMLTAIPKVLDITEEEEIDQLLEVLKIDDNEQALDLIKLIVSHAGWSSIKTAITNALKEQTPENIRMALLNLIGGRMLSNFANDMNELKRLSKFYKYLQDAEGYPEKANLVNAIFKVFYDWFRRGK